MTGKIPLAAVLAILVFGGLVYFNRDVIASWVFRPTPSDVATGEFNSETSSPEVVVENLNIPWELVFLPSGEILVTERPGRLLFIGDSREVIEVEGVVHRGEGGLLGLALHPRFEENNFIYLYFTTQSNGTITNRVERYVFAEQRLFGRTTIIENIPGASNHDGGRIAFGSDGMLYISTGDAGNEQNSQNTNSLAGKILRVRDDGSIPADNPFGNAVYAYGLRNVQGLAWDAEGNLWATDHGRSGARSGYDELNKITRGGNYGWPNFEGDATGQGVISPELHSGSTETWAPSGATRVGNHMIFAGLRGESLYAADISTGSAQNLQAYLRGEFGRLRTAVLGPDGMLYVLTNNRDGRGQPVSTDDRIIKIDPEFLGF